MNKDAIKAMQQRARILLRARQQTRTALKRWLNAFNAVQVHAIKADWFKSVLQQGRPLIAFKLSRECEDDPAGFKWSGRL